ncbi:interphotoreceptor matrix proteoglycan 2-like [Etheostoma cragini]|uniref:interphotoreceptor matrix proteoglycan 2-like n=1 Tax=Etheostoma cragini TaxID=417921 RepID=UPI00155F2440|nr:interphotoreceptor matrix proteoglycan 2-like [Etheostoma cragini]
MCICRCRVGENWWYRGERCEEFVSETLVVAIAVASVMGFLAVTGAVLFFLSRTLREQYDAEDSEDPLRQGDSVPTLERAGRFNPVFESEPLSPRYYRGYDDDRTGPVSARSYRRYDDGDGCRALASAEIRNFYEDKALSRQEMEERVRILQLCSTDEHFADFVRQTQAFLERRAGADT